MKLTAEMMDTYQVTLDVDGHEYLIDQSKENGGKGTGANPSDMLIAAVAACKTMVAKSFLDSKEIEYQRVNTEIDYEFNGPNKNITVSMTVRLNVVGATVDETELRQLQTIVATGCPVANLMDSDKNTIETIVTVS
ncbi:OsmC family protein [Jeotgalibaca sp. MA1X17-3]|uniref:OsmC family protein n=1 Tax=Jeotgalibaca sp. MA1X17-3 TaxID=2908211 RepID=UPI001F16245A|nr:OsmC family protein [Jeotgalibaca sp. MA1X17-3]UJF15809.1 OsmC family protein [Jeotgalibaca sp. MA1X17-3]